MGRITAGVNCTVKAERLRFCYRIARLGLITSTVICIINCIFAFFGGIVYSTFTWVFPFAMINHGLFWTGRLHTPEEYEAYWGITQDQLASPLPLYTMMGVALLAIGILVVCCIFSKKHVGFMIAAIPLAVADKLFMLFWYNDAWQFHTDYVMMVCMVTLWIIGVVSYFKLRTLEWMGESPTSAASQGAPEVDGEVVNSPVLHVVDYSEKSKILMLKSVSGYMICYRKVGNVRELEIDRKVYDTVDAGRYAQPHELCAYLDGHEIVVGLDTDTMTYMRFDGEVVHRERRGI